MGPVLSEQRTLLMRHVLRFRHTNGPHGTLPSRSLWFSYRHLTVSFPSLFSSLPAS